MVKYLIILLFVILILFCFKYNFNKETFVTTLSNGPDDLIAIQTLSAISRNLINDRGIKVQSDGSFSTLKIPSDISIAGLCKFDKDIDISGNAIIKENFKVKNNLIANDAIILNDGLSIFGYGQLIIGSTNIMESIKQIEKRLSSYIKIINDNPRLLKSNTPINITGSFKIN